MRHGSASNETSLYKDIDRPLSNSGIQEAIKAAKSIASKNPKPGRILCSNAARTKKTAEIIIHENNWELASLESDPELYLASSTSLIYKISRLSISTEHLMVVSNNPGLTDLVKYLLPHLIISMSTCSFLTVQFTKKIIDLNLEFEIKHYAYNITTDHKW